jgi:hypothetical protein
VMMLRSSRQKPTASSLSWDSIVTEKAKAQIGSFSLPIGQDVLIHEMAAQSKHVIVSVTPGGAVELRAGLTTYLHVLNNGPRENRQNGDC